MISNWIQRVVMSVGACVALTLTACGDDTASTSPPPAAAKAGTVSGVLVDASSGLVLPGVTVQSADRSATTADDGHYQLTQVPESATASVRFTRNGYAPSVAVVAVADQATVSLDARLTPIDTSAAVDASQAATVASTASPAQVSLQAASLTAADGTTFTGTATVSVTAIDGGANAANLPGTFVAAAVGSDPARTLESLGAVSVNLSDAAGQPLQLAAGKPAELRIPAVVGNTPPANAALFYFNEATGLWVEEGAAVLVGDAPNQYYQGTVSHFTYWMVARAVTTVAVTGCVQDGTGARLASANVVAGGIDYVGRTTAVTAADGSFSLSVRNGGLALLTADSSAGSSDGLRVGPSASAINLESCLVVSTAVALPTLVQSPAAQSAQQAGFAVFDVVAAGQGPLRYQWLKNGTAIAGATGPHLLVTNLQASDNGAAFRVAVTNAAGTVTSEPASLTVTPVDSGTGTPPVTSQPPVETPSLSISAQPASTSVAIGQTASFSITATGASDLSYQWRRNGVAIDGATAASYQTGAVAYANNGEVYSVLVSGGGTSLASASASLSVVLQVATTGGHILASIDNYAASTVLHFADGNRSRTPAAIVSVSTDSLTAAAVAIEPSTGAYPLTNYQHSIEYSLKDGKVSALRKRFDFYAKNDHYYVVDHLGASDGSVSSRQLSTLATQEVCSLQYITPQGQDAAVPSKGWLFMPTPAADGKCRPASSTESAKAVRMDMSATDAPVAIGKPMARVSDASGAFLGLVVLEGNQIRLLDADLKAKADLYTIAGDGSFRYRDTMPAQPDLWLFSDIGQVWAVNLKKPSVRVPVTTLSSGEFITRNVSDGTTTYIGITDGVTTRIVSFNADLSTSTLATMNGRLTQMRLTPTTVAAVVLSTPATDDYLSTAAGQLVTVAKASGAISVLRALSGGETQGYMVASAETLYMPLYSNDFATANTLVVGSDGSSPEVLPFTDTYDEIAPALGTPAEVFGSNVGAVMLVQGRNQGSNSAPRILIAQGATRTVIAYEDPLPGDAAWAIEPNAFDRSLQLGQAGVFVRSSNTSTDLYAYRSGTAGLTKVGSTAGALKIRPATRSTASAATQRKTQARTRLSAQ
ncbi:MAG TPA: carboxypeptidase regulatory-like domain-containing protein [Ideonella sp.]|uniref:carboxypeptidase regulatory-like domain-containing protein n=1 Tax=Ideonella sp. TaxID=1929293 RepID=UPI002C4F3955|nr:carboxypeptidase regulatory-like domain-containing protein [Ideonella sp.]HSI51299.1 carboxypeptidase regulatory-like domain-containing protein [Ideonella sp.]